MRLLITNDDGITAPGLKVLDRIAREIAGPEGEVWTIAPAFEQSGVGHCISYTRPTLVSKLEERRYAVEGSPADCVLAGVHDIMPERPDLVLSGVNRGNNAGENVLYSGTIGAAMEAALQGLPAIALSQFYGPRNKDLDDPFEPATLHGTATVRKILDHGIWDSADYRLFYNVNFPPCPAVETQGLAVTTQGWRTKAGHAVAPHISPSGRRFLYVTGGPQNERTAPGTDVAANMEDRISVTPMRCDLTAHDLVDRLRDTLE
ncbi:5'/3'-nucleotidase SurE [Palleronia caenipelagi]|uniref:5'-nucleotidase SurE n=1 Tax=Palleronia caenipelagi TaxID=2489174 RepID=A0A547Q9F9_9RHOB|nr:5'/3'-nucleotidase SurE [Palleronia caenipelagi]TRD23023.1 5'/3'-nucleotidase SurE [Palleronia caenipelagi]